MINVLWLFVKYPVKKIDLINSTWWIKLSFNKSCVIFKTKQRSKIDNFL